MICLQEGSVKLTKQKLKEMIKKELMTEKKSDKIQIPGVGVSSYDNLKKNVEGKLKDLTKRNKKGSHYGVAETQFRLVGVMWKALADYEEKQ